MKTLTAYRFGRKTFKEFDFEGVWRESFGRPEQSSRWLIFGGSGQGKTEFCCQLAGYMAGFGRILYASAEQGESSSLRQAFERNGLLVRKNITLASRFDFKELLNAVKKSRYKAVIVDSIDHINMNGEACKELDAAAKNKLLAFVAWADGKRPKSQAARDMEYRSDVKIEIRHYAAFPRSRYGGNHPYVIYEAKAREAHAFLNRALYE